MTSDCKARVRLALAQAAQAGLSGMRVTVPSGAARKVRVSARTVEVAASRTTRCCSAWQW